MVHTLQAKQLEAAGNKVLPRALRWCSKNVGVLQKLLSCPSATGPGRLGLHRLHTVSLLAALVRARRGPLTGALLEAKPCVLGRAIELMLAHPGAGTFHFAVLALATDVRAPFRRNVRNGPSHRGAYTPLRV